MNVYINSTADNVDKETYLNMLYNTGFFISCIDKPSRVTEHSQTCLGHIFIKHSNYQDISSAVFKTYITDHYSITAKLNCSYNKVDSGTGSGTQLEYARNELAVEGCANYSGMIDSVRVSSPARQLAIHRHPPHLCYIPPIPLSS